VFARPGQVDLFLGQGPRGPEPAGVELDPGGQLQGLENRIRFLHVLSGNHNPMVFHDHGIDTLFKFNSKNVTELLAAHAGIGGEGDRATDDAGDWHQTDIRQLAHQSKRNEGRRMGMQDGTDIISRFVDRLVERQLARRSHAGIDRALFGDLDHVAPGQDPLVQGGRGDPDVTIGIQDGKIATGSGGQAIGIDPGHKRDQLVSGVHDFQAHLLLPQGRIFRYYQHTTPVNSSKRSRSYFQRVFLGIKLDHHATATRRCVTSSQ